MSGIEYIIQFVGCLIQTAPVAIFIFMPFEKYELRVSGGKLYMSIGIFLTVYGLIFSKYIGAIYAWQLTGGQIQDRANMLMTMALCATCILFWINIKKKNLKTGLVFLTAVYYEAIVYTLSSLMIHQLSFLENVNRPPYSWENLFSLGISTAITLPMMQRVMRTQLREMYGLMNSHQLVRSCIYMGAELALYCIFMYFIPSFNGYRALFLIMCYIISSVLALYFFLREIHLIHEQMSMEEKLRMFNLEYDAIRNHIDEMARFRHDMRHHFGIISTLNAEGKKDELSAYLQRYADAYEKFEHDRICDYPLINTILKYYIERCRRENIQTETIVHLREDMGFDPVDMTVLLGNCLENAINACMQLPENERYMCVKMMKMNGALLIYVENTMSAEENGISEKLPWTVHLRHSRGNGYGKDSIYKITKKYDGSVEFKQKNNRFMTQIVLNI